MDDFPIRLDLRRKAPIHQQLQEQLQQLIEDGTLQPGEQLPAVRALADQLQVNFNTIARAYRALDQAGYINTHQGRGTYVILRESHSDAPQVPENKKLLEETLNKKAVDLCQLATNAGFTLREIQQIIAHQMRQSRKNAKKYPVSHRPTRKITKKLAGRPVIKPAPGYPKRKPPIKRMIRCRRK